MAPHSSHDQAAAFCAVFSAVPYNLLHDNRRGCCRCACGQCDKSQTAAVPSVTLPDSRFSLALMITTVDGSACIAWCQQTRLKRSAPNSMVDHGHGNLPPSRRHTCKTQLEIDLSAAHVHIATSYKVHSDRSAHSIGLDYARSDLCNYQTGASPLTIARHNACGRNFHSAIRYQLVYILYISVQLQFIHLDPLRRLKTGM